MTMEHAIDCKTRNWEQLQARNSKLWQKSNSSELQAMAEKQDRCQKKTRYMLEKGKIDVEEQDRC
jgi:hypothetical protein